MVQAVAPIKPEYIINVEKDPEDKTIREKGQNKKRPKRKVFDTIRLCSNAALGIQCTRENCKYSHDIDEYLNCKEPDLGTDCVLFNLMGKCSFGVKCRFAVAHLEGKVNKVDEERFKAYEPTVFNSWSSRIQEGLRKRTLNTKLSDDYVSQRRKIKALHSDGSIKDDELLNHIKGIKVSIKEEREDTDTSDVFIRMRPCERKKIDFKNKLYLAPLTTVGNLPFRRICKMYGADITCGEMALSTSIISGQPADWALLKRHISEDVFGVQICGNRYEDMTRCAEILSKYCDVDFIDINMGCPIDQVYNKGMGSGLLEKVSKIADILTGMTQVVDCPITVKVRTGIHDGKNIVHDKLIPIFKSFNVAAITVHGRSRQQRYSRLADWEYVRTCAKAAGDDLPVIGNGDIFSFEDYNREVQGISSVMIARGALIKPWIFTEIKEQRHWDISSSERFDLLKQYANYGLEHFGTDTEGVNKTRRFMLEWISFLRRYIPVGLLEVLPQKMNERPPSYFGRNELETLMASDNVKDWIELTNRILGKAPESFEFMPKHKANSY
jgi:tRNA-dihydrouridine synthase 3